MQERIPHHNRMLNGRSLLLLEDDLLLRKSLAAFLESHGATIWQANSLQEARELLGSQVFDLALMDVNLPDGNSLDLLREGRFPETTQIAIMTAEGGVSTAVEAMRLGAGDYLSKPFDPEELPIVFGRMRAVKAKDRIESFKQQSRAPTTQSLFFGERLKAIETQMERIIEAEKRLAGRLPPILIEGETGTGKSSLARHVHNAGPRAAMPFVEVNCSTLPETLAESELFGHEKGAFTDARKERIGLFEAASGGTLFLDEIASLPLPLQAKVLTAIEDQRIRRVGANRSLPIDTRLIAASLQPLATLVEEGSFREDLYHRLNLLHIHLPPIRDYPQDLRDMADFLLEGLRKRYRMPKAQFSPDIGERLRNYGWPGNIRELSHEIEKCLIFSSGEAITLSLPGRGKPQSETRSEGNPDLLNPDFVLPAENFQLEESLNALTLQLIKEAMQANGENVSAAARQLGVPRDFVRYRLKNFSG